MDEKLQAQVEEARAAGYTDEQIQQFLKAEPVARLDKKQDASGEPVSPFVNRDEEAVGTAQYGAAELAKALAIGGGGYYGLKKVAQALRGPAAGPVAPTPAVPTVAPASAPPPASAPLDRGGQAVKDFVQQRGQYSPASGPVRPTTVPGQPVVGAPQTAGIGTDLATAKQRMAPQQSIAQRMQQIAASRVAPVVRGAGGIAAAVMPGNMGQNYPFPQKGPMAGQEINPMTGQPWTPAELQQYNSAY